MTIRRFFSCLTLLAMLSGFSVGYAPVPAQAVVVSDPGTLAATLKQTAQDAWNFMKEIAVLGDILQGLLTIYDTVTGLFDELFDKLDLHQAIRSSTEWLKMKMDAKMYDARTTDDWFLDRIQGQAEIAAQDPVSPEAITALCRTERSKQISRNMTQYQKDGAANLLNGAVGYYTMLGDGKGAAYLANMKYNNDRALAAAEKIGISKTAIFNADLLALNINREPFQEPNLVPIKDASGKLMETNGVTLKVPEYDNQNKNELYFMLAHNLYYALMGPGEAQPQGETAKTPTGMARDTQFGINMVQKTAYLKPIAERIYYLTRPNCSADARSKLACEQTISLCKAAKAAGMDLPASYDDCKQPLSPFQAQEIVNLWCSRGSHYAVLGATGVAQGSMLQSSDTCQQMITEWENYKQGSDLALLEATKGLLALQGR